MYSVPSEIAGDERTTSAVANLHFSLPDAASKAYTRPSPLPNYTPPVPHRGRRKKIIPGVRHGFARWKQPVKVAGRITPLAGRLNSPFQLACRLVECVERPS
jgi:hypothetical protein